MNRADIYAKCPFYRTIKRMKRGGYIDCNEGIGKARITLKYSSTRELERHFEVRCCEFFQVCPLYQLIIRENYEE